MSLIKYLILVCLLIATTAVIVEIILLLTPPIPNWGIVTLSISISVTIANIILDPLLDE